MTKTRKLLFFEISVLSTEDGKPLSHDKHDFLERLPQITEVLTKEERIQRKNDLQKKYYYLDVVTRSVPEGIGLIFCKADSGYRPPVEDFRTLEVEDNPLKETQSPLEYTHALVAKKGNTLYLIIEDGGGTISSSQAKEAINILIQKLYRKEGQEKVPYGIKIEGMLRGDFLDQLSRFRKISLGKILASKRVLEANAALRGISQLSEVREELEIKLVLLEDGNAFKRMVETELYPLMNVQDPYVNGIVVSGELEDGSAWKLSTDFLLWVESVQVEINSQTGIVTSSNIFSIMAGYLTAMPPV